MTATLTTTTLPVLTLCQYSRTEILADHRLAVCPLGLTRAEHERCGCRRREVVRRRGLDLRVLTCRFPNLWNGRPIRNAAAYAKAIKATKTLKVETEEGNVARKAMMATAPKEDVVDVEIEGGQTTALAPAAAPLTTALVPTAPVTPAVSASAGDLAPRDLASAIKLAEVMASAKLVPFFLQGKVGDCFMVVEQAMRWGMSPFQVAQCTSIVQGKLCYEGKLVAAVINTRAGLTGRLRYEYSGQGEGRQVRVVGQFRTEAEPRDVTVRWADALTRTKGGQINEAWLKMPDQMLAYAGAKAWARRHAPECMLGVYTDDEFDGPSGPGVPAPAPVTVTMLPPTTAEAAPALPAAPSVAPAPTNGNGTGNGPTPAPIIAKAGKATPDQLAKLVKLRKEWLDRTKPANVGQAWVALLTPYGVATATELLPEQADALIVTLWGKISDLDREETLDDAADQEDKDQAQASEADRRATLDAEAEARTADPATFPPVGE